MQKISFTESLDLVVASDPRYYREAYMFLRDALDFTVKLRKRNKLDPASRHVSGQELLDGIRQYALKEFGPMVVTVFAYWGISKCDDFGEMVFNLIRSGIFGKTERDSLSDFQGGYSFQEAFVDPFLPQKTTDKPSRAKDKHAEKLR